MRPWIAEITKSPILHPSYFIIKDLRQVILLGDREFSELFLRTPLNGGYPANICSKSTIVRNIFKVNNKTTRTTSMTLNKEMLAGYLMMNFVILAY